MVRAKTLASLSILGAIALHCGGSSNFGGVGDGGDGCNKDTDCKGERVCRENRCVEPEGEGVDGGSTDGGKKDSDKPGSDGGDKEDGGDPFACITDEVGTQRGPVVLEIVLDGSGSMDSDNKWTAAKDGLVAFFDEIEQASPTDLALGLMIYEDADDPTQGQGPYPSSVDVYPQLVNTSHATKLRDRINNTTPSGGTPTQIALQGAHTMLQNYVAPAGSFANARRTALLISDGVPNGGAAEQAACVNIAKNALTLPPPVGPILTFSVGVGPFPGNQFSYDPKFMGDLAVAGGTRATPQCNPASTNISSVCHIQITPGAVPVSQLAQQFLSAVRRARTGASGCTLNLTAASGSYDPNRVTVAFKNSSGALSLVPRDGTDGWEFDDPNNPTKIEFHGAACGDLSSAADVKVFQACEP
jgi:uncharacterized protein YegL